MNTQKTKKITAKTLQRAVYLAYLNWDDWRADFERSNDSFPLLDNDLRFKNFLSEYSLIRGVPKSSAEENFKDSAKTVRPTVNFLRAFLAKEITKITRENLATFAVKFPHNLQTLHGKNAIAENWNRQTSLVSKVCSKYRPEDFPMWDTHARSGLNSIAPVPIAESAPKTQGKPIHNYKGFADAFDAMFAAHENQLIAGCEKYLPNDKPLADNVGFQKRVFDKVLMEIGMGRD